MPRVLVELADGAALSGSELGARLGFSRAAVWKQVRRLRELGLQVSARAGSGYRLDRAFEPLDRATILAAMSASSRQRLGDLTVHWELDSTNSELLRRLTEDRHDLLACVTEIQTQGRGRRGREWRMPLGGGVALSLLARFDRGIATLAGLSLAVGVAVADALSDCGIDGVGLKWPNDLVARERKLGGILVELGGDALGPCHAVIGIGINLRLDAEASTTIGQPVIDLATLAGDKRLARNHLVACLLQRLGAALDLFRSEGFGAFAKAFERRDTLASRPVRVVRDDGSADGIARGVDARGALRVAFGDCVQALDSGEVTIRNLP